MTWKTKIAPLTQQVLRSRFAFTLAVFVIMRCSKLLPLRRALAHAAAPPCCCSRTRGLASSSLALQWDAHRLSADQLHFRQLASDFARDELMPSAAEWDHKGHFPVDILRKAATLGFGGIFCCPEFGGSNCVQKGKDPLFVLVAGAVKCSDGVLMSVLSYSLMAAMVLVLPLSKNCSHALELLRKKLTQII
ncbi:hypothetical protein L7F22_017965 [Adiantum nelumboides]|nr:hypothetical protein [Adiantum nelumboides]